jgi:hypothetical protein
MTGAKKSWHRLIRCFLVDVRHPLAEPRSSSRGQSVFGEPGQHISTPAPPALISGTWALQKVVGEAEGHHVKALKGALADAQKKMAGDGADDNR